MANIKAGPEAKCSAISRPEVFQAKLFERDKVLDNLVAGKLEREKCDIEIARFVAEKKQSEEMMERERRDRAAIAKKAELDQRDREIAKMMAEKRECEMKMGREKREKELARHKELHQVRVEKKAEAAFGAACCVDRADEERAKQKMQQILALEDFRQRQAKQWLGGGVAQAISPTHLPAGRCLVRNEIVSPAPIHDVDIAVAKRLWSAQSPALNSVDQVKARGAAQKIEEQQKYEHALAIARKQAYLERLAAEDRRKRELHSALREQGLMAINSPAVVNLQVPQIGASGHSVPSVHHSPHSESAIPIQENILNLESALSAKIDKNPQTFADIEGSQDSKASEIVEQSQDLGLDISEADKLEEQSFCEVVGELRKLTLDRSSTINADDDDDDDDNNDDTSVFEKIERLRLQLETNLGTQNFLQLYRLARECQDGSSGKLESEIESICSQNPDLIFNNLVQLLNFESEVYN